MKIKQCAENPNAVVTRPCRKLYVGNLPANLGCNEKMYREFFEQVFKGLGMQTELPIMSIWINGDGTFCFLEMRSVQETTLCLYLCSGLIFGGRNLRFGRPADYALPPQHLKCYIVGESEPMEGQKYPYTLPAMKKNSEAWRMAQTVLTKDSEGQLEPEQMQGLASTASSYKSRVLMLENCVLNKEVTEDAEYLDVIADIREECEQWGKLLQVIVPREGLDTCGFDRVFLRYELQSEADKCVIKTQGRIFVDRTVKCKYYDEGLFKQGVWDQDPIPSEEEVAAAQREAEQAEANSKPEN